MNEQAVEGIADGYAAGLGVVDDRLAHLQVTILIKIGVHDTGTRLDDRYTGGVSDKVDEFATATGDAEVDIADGIQHLTRCLMGGGQEGYDILRYAILFQDLMDQCHFLAVTAVGILTTFQYTGITALETEGEDIERHIRTRLVDHADHTEGHTDTTEPQTVGQGLLFGDMSQWGRQGGDVTHVAGDTLQTTLRQLQTVVEGIRLLHLCQVLGVGLKDARLLGDDGICNGIQDVIALCVCQQGQTLAGFLDAFKCLFQFHLSSMLRILCEVLNRGSR